MPVAAWLAKQENELDVVLDDRIRFVGLAKKRRSVPSNLRHSIRDLVPDDRGERVKPYFLAVHLNMRVQGFNKVPTVAPSRPADVTDDNAQPASGHEVVVAVLPHAPQFGQEFLTVIDVAELRSVEVVRVSLEIPVWR